MQKINQCFKVGLGIVVIFALGAFFLINVQIGVAQEEDSYTYVVNTGPLSVGGYLTKYRASDGGMIWRISGLQHVEPGPVTYYYQPQSVSVTGDYAYLATNVTIEKRRSSDGSLVWSQAADIVVGDPYNFTRYYAIDIAVAGDSVYVINSGPLTVGGNLTKYRASDGEMIWRISGLQHVEPGPVTYYYQPQSVSVTGDYAYLATNVTIEKRAISDGSLVWSKDADIVIGDPANYTRYYTMDIGAVGGQSGDTSTISVTYPNGAESLIGGTQATVEWTSSGTVGNVDIRLSTNNGSSWTTLVSNTANDGSETVTLPDVLSTRCLILVEETDGSPSDMSDSNFTIISPSFAFDPAPNPVLQTINQGDSTSYILYLTSINGYDSQVTLSVGSITPRPWPDEDALTCSFSPNQITPEDPSAAVTLNVSTSAKLQPDRIYTIDVMATDGNKTQSTYVTLKVNPYGNPYTADELIELGKKLLFEENDPYAADAKFANALDLIGPNPGDPNYQKANFWRSISIGSSNINLRTMLRDLEIMGEAGDGDPTEEPLILDKQHDLIYNPSVVNTTVLDNTDAGYSETDPTGNWQTPIPTHKTTYGINCRIHSASGDPNSPNKAVWTFTVPQAGEYGVHIWYPDIEGLTPAPDAKYTVYYDGGSQTITWGQGRHHGQWHRLGKYKFTPDQPARVELSDYASGGYVIADAVKFEYEGIYISETEAAFTESWETISGMGGRDNSYKEIVAGTGGACVWTPNVPETGKYQIEGYWAETPEGATDAIFTITPAGGSSTQVSVNQREEGHHIARDSLGTYTLQAGTGNSIMLSQSASGKVTTDGIILLPVRDYPNLTDVQNDITASSLTELEQALGLLNNVTDAFADTLDFGIKNEFGNPVVIELDYGDVLMLKAMYDYQKAWMNINLAYDMGNLDPLEIGTTYKGLLSVNYILGKYPNLGDLNADAAARLSTAKSALITSINTYFAGYDFITAETDQQDDDLITFDPNDAEMFSAFNDKLTEVKGNLEGGAPFTFSSADFGDESNPPSFEVTMNLRALFDNPTALRSLLPQFDNNNYPRRGTWPDPTFGGVLVDMTSDELNGLLKLGSFLYDPEVSWNGDNVSVILNWKEDAFDDFVRYKLYRSTTANVDETSQEVYNSDQKGVITFTDAVDPAQRMYYYRLYTYYSNGDKSASSIKQVITKFYTDIANTSGTEDGSPEHPYKLLRDAIENSTNGTKICVAKGTYYESEETLHYFYHLSSFVLEGGYDGANWTRDIAANPTGIAGKEGENYLGSQHVLGLYNMNNVTIDGFTIQEGKRCVISISDTASAVIKNCTVKDSLEEHGIAVNGNSTVTIANCTVINNTLDLTRWGTGIGAWNGAVVTVENCIITKNNGDGLNCKGGKLTVKGCEASENKRSNISIINAPDSTVENCTVKDSKRDHGIAVSNSTGVTIKNCTITNTSAELGYWGAAIGVWDNAVVTIENCVINKNNYDPVHAYRNGSFTIKNSTISENGRGINASNGSTAVIQDCVINMNLGWEAVNSNMGSALTVTGCQITGNQHRAIRVTNATINNYWYSVWGGDTLLSEADRYDPWNHGYTDLGGDNITRTFTHGETSYQYYLIVTSPGNPVNVDTLQDSGGVYYAPIAAGNTGNLSNIGGAPDGLYGILGTGTQGGGYLLIQPAPENSSLKVYIVDNQVANANITIENCTIKNNPDGCISLWNTADKVTLRNNLLLTNSNSRSISCEGNDSPEIINNTIVNTSESKTGGGVEWWNTGAGIAPVIKDNIITGHTSGISFPVGTTSAVIDYNDVWNNSTNYSNCSAGPHDISQSPLFVGGPYGNYYLSQTSSWQSANSPCVDTGDPSINPTAGFTTKTNGGEDTTPIDIGYHYPALVNNISAVVINEILPNPTGDDAGNEWIELYNRHSEPVDISGCWIDDITGGGSNPVQIPNGTIIPAHGFYSMTMPGNSYFNNTTDTTNFLWPNGEGIIDTYSYTSTTEGASFYRYPDGQNWAGEVDTTPTRDASNTNTNPTAYIDSISPNPALQGGTVTLVGHGQDSDGAIAAYKWRSSIDGDFGNTATLLTSNLSAGTHTIYFKVQDNQGAWSDEVSSELKVRGVRITTPQAGSILSGTVIVEAEASHPAEVASVYLYVDGAYYSYDWNAPYQLSWNTIYYPNDSTHKLKVWTVFKSPYQTASSEEITVTVHNDNPIITTLAVVDPTPQGQTAISGTVVVNVTGNDLNNFSYVYLSCDDSYIGYDKQTPFQFNWNTIHFANGAHTLKAKGYHNGLKNWVESVPLIVTVDNTNPDVPSVTITNLTDGQTVLGDITIQASVSHPANMKYVLFYIDGVQFYYDWQPPFEAILPTQFFTNAAHTIKVVSYFTGSSIKCEDIITVNVNNPGGQISPQVSIDNLTDGQNVQGTVTIQASTNDTKYFNYLNCYVYDPINNTTTSIGFDNAAPYQFSWLTNYFNDGAYTIKVQGYHRLTNQRYEDTVNVNVANGTTPPAPELLINNPTNGQQVSGNVVITATTNDTTQMKYAYFYVDGQYMGYDQDSPFQMTWQTRYWSNGAHTIKVISYHSALYKYYTKGVTITVNNTNPIVPTVSISSHTNGQTVSGTQSITMSSNDPSNVRYMYLYIDGMYAGFDATSPYALNCDTTKYTNGTHSFKIMSYHTILNKYIESQELSLNVQN